MSVCAPVVFAMKVAINHAKTTSVSTKIVACMRKIRINVNLAAKFLRHVQGERIAPDLHAQGKATASRHVDAYKSYELRIIIYRHILQFLHSAKICYKLVDTIYRKCKLVAVYKEKEYVYEGGKI